MSQFRDYVELATGVREDNDYAANLAAFVKTLTKTENIDPVLKEASELPGLKVIFDPEQNYSLKVQPEGVTTVQAGVFTRPSVEELRAALVLATGAPAAEEPVDGVVRIRNVVGEAATTHRDPRNIGAVFQAASQFNCLEFASPNVTPEHGIVMYEDDRTQGPACAMACAPATVFRNYLVPNVNGKEGHGQSKDNQINCLQDIENELKTPEMQVKVKDAVNSEFPEFWTTKNGYVDSTMQLLGAFNSLLIHNPDLTEKFRGMLRVGVHADTLVTSKPPVPAPGQGGLTGSGWGQPAGYVPPPQPEPEEVPPTDPKYVEKEPIVTQVFCSAISVGYSRNVHDPNLWKPISCIVLDGTYEATLIVGALNNIRRHKLGLNPKPVLLTKVGGGVFRNEPVWISDAIKRAAANVSKYKLPTPLDVQIVHFGAVEGHYRFFDKPAAPTETLSPVQSQPHTQSDL